MTGSTSSGSGRRSWDLARGARQVAPSVGMVLALSMALAPGTSCSRRAVSQTASVHSTVLATTAPAAEPPPTASAAATTLELWDTDRIRSELRRHRGQPLVVHMWASWCGPCLEELPAIDAFAQRARARGIAVLSLSLDTDYRSGGTVPAVLRDRAPHLTPIIARFEDAGPFMAMFSRDWEGTIPALFAFDRAGRLEKSVLDMVGTAELDRLVDALAGRAKPRP